MCNVSGIGKRPLSAAEVLLPPAGTRVQCRVKIRFRLLPAGYLKQLNQLKQRRLWTVSCFRKAHDPLFGELDVHCQQGNRAISTAYNYGASELATVRIAFETATT